MAAGSDPTAGELFQLFRNGEQLTRAQICARTGLSRGSAVQRLERLESLGLITPAQKAPSTGGRPASRFAFRPPSLGVIGAHLSPTRIQVGLYDLSGQRVSQTSIVPASPSPDLEELLVAGDLLSITSNPTSPRIVGVGLTGDDCPRTYLERPYSGTDLSIRAYSTLESKAIAEIHGSNTDATLLYVHIGERVSCAFATNNEVHWMTADIGHASVPNEMPRKCSCGNTFCFQSVANGHPEAERDGEALNLRQIGENIGSGVTPLISLLVPDRLVIDSPWNGSEHVLAGLREWIYGRVSTAAALKVSISYPDPRRSEPTAAAALCVIQEILSSQTIDAL